MNHTMKKSGIRLKVLLCLLGSSLLITVQSCGGSDSSIPPQSSGGEQASSSAASVSSDNGEGIGHFAGKEVAAFDAALAEQGKVIFESKCAACHKTSNEKVVGPGLKGVTERRKPQWILNMITNPVEMTQQDPAAKELLAEHLTQMTNQDIADADALALLNYLRQNDGAK